MHLQGSEGPGIGLVTEYPRGYNSRAGKPHSWQVERLWCVFAAAGEVAGLMNSLTGSCSYRKLLSIVLLTPRCLGGASSYLDFGYRAAESRRVKESQKHKRLQTEQQIKNRFVSFVQEAEEEDRVSVESMTVIAPQPIEANFAVCWNPLRTPTNNLADFTLQIGVALGYGRRFG